MVGMSAEYFCGFFIFPKQKCFVTLIEKCTRAQRMLI